MAKTMLVILILIFMNGCGEKKVELTPKINEKNSTVTTATESNNITVNEPIDVVTESDFVPAHIANSTIEVVPH